MVPKNKLLNFLKKVYQSKELTGKESLLLPDDFSLPLDSQTFIQEIAGRDSLASFTSFINQNPDFKTVVLSAAFSPTEYGNLNYLLEALYLAGEIAEKGGLGFYFSISKSIFAWEKLVSKNVLSDSKKYGFYSPCIGCHFYLHLLRAVLAKESGIKTVVSGERFYHRGKIKVNQSPVVLNFYFEFFKKIDLQIVFPVANLDDEEEILRLLPKKWEEGKDQLTCYFTGSSKLETFEYKNIEENIKRYLNEELEKRGLEVFNELLRY